MSSQFQRRPQTALTAIFLNPHLDGWLKVALVQIADGFNRFFERGAQITRGVTASGRIVP
jgi:hypothetical protein